MGKILVDKLGADTSNWVRRGLLETKNLKSSEKNTLFENDRITGVLVTKE